jgi:hypothetical protein
MIRIEIGAIHSRFRCDMGQSPTLGTTLGSNVILMSRGYCGIRTIVKFIVIKEFLTFLNGDELIRTAGILCMSNPMNDEEEQQSSVEVAQESEQGPRHLYVWPRANAGKVAYWLNTL